MLFLEELQNLCMDRLHDAKIFYNEGRLDGAYYVCGYVIELRLKKQICKTLGWQGYPGSRKEFENLASFKTHDLAVLLHLSGVENYVKEHLISDWSVVNTWDPGIRYFWGIQTERSVKDMLRAADSFLENL